MRSVLASRPIPLAKSRACFGLTTATGSPSLAMRRPQAPRTASGFHDDQTHCQRLHRRRQRRMAVDVIGKSLCRPGATEHSHVDVSFRHVDTYHH